MVVRSSLGAHTKENRFPSRKETPSKLLSNKSVGSHPLQAQRKPNIRYFLISKSLRTFFTCVPDCKYKDQHVQHWIVYGLIVIWFLICLTAYRIFVPCCRFCCSTIRLYCPRSTNIETMSGYIFRLDASQCISNSSNVAAFMSGTFASMYSNRSRNRRFAVLSASSGLILSFRA